MNPHSLSALESAQRVQMHSPIPCSEAAPSQITALRVIGAPPPIQRDASFARGGVIVWVGSSARKVGASAHTGSHSPPCASPVAIAVLVSHCVMGVLTMCRLSALSAGIFMEYFPDSSRPTRRQTKVVTKLLLVTLTTLWTRSGAREALVRLWHYRDDLAAGCEVLKIVM